MLHTTFDSVLAVANGAASGVGVAPAVQAVTTAVQGTQYTGTFVVVPPTGGPFTLKSLLGINTSGYSFYLANTDLNSAGVTFTVTVKDISNNGGGIFTLSPGARLVFAGVTFAGTTGACAPGNWLVQASGANGVLEGGQVF